MSEPAPSANHMDQHPENAGGLVSYDIRFDSYALRVGRDASQQIYHCPWCGERLPPSQRDKWYDELEALGIDPMKEPCPAKYTTDEWRR